MKCFENNDVRSTPSGYTLVSRDVVAMLPNIDNNLGNNAAGKALETRAN